MIKYRADFYGRPTIIVMHVVHETDNSVFVEAFPKNARWSKISGGSVICDTWEDARNVLIKQIKERMAKTEQMFAQYQAMLVATEGMTPPSSEETRNENVPN